MIIVTMTMKTMPLQPLKTEEEEATTSTTEVEATSTTEEGVIRIIEIRNQRSLLYLGGMILSQWKRLNLKMWKPKRWLNLKKRRRNRNHLRRSKIQNQWLNSQQERRNRTLLSHKRRKRNKFQVAKNQLNSNKKNRKSKRIFRKRQMRKLK